MLAVISTTVTSGNKPQDTLEYRAKEKEIMKSSLCLWPASRI